MLIATDMQTRIGRQLKTIIGMLVLLPVWACTQPEQTVDSKADLARHVNPFIGTAFTGHTFPGATYPLGMMQPGPETGNFSWDYCSGYFYDDERINGFSQNRLNGTGWSTWETCWYNPLREKSEKT